MKSVADEALNDVPTLKHVIVTNRVELGNIPWNPNCDISEPKDDIINHYDLAVFTENWFPSF